MANKTSASVAKYAAKPSFSAMNKFQTCARLWFYEYGMGRWAPKSPALKFGNDFHDFIARLPYVGDEYKITADYQSLAEKAFAKTVKALQLDFNQQFLVEQKFYVGQTMCILDLIARDSDGKVYIIDWKTTSRDYTEHDIRSSEQLDLYAAAYYKQFDEWPDYVAYATANKRTAEITVYVRPVNIDQSTAVAIKIKGYQKTIELFGNKMQNYPKSTASCDDMYGAPCRFYEECWPTANEEVKVITTEPIGFKVGR